jgi:hypothetical protein
MSLFSPFYSTAGRSARVHHPRGPITAGPITIERRTTPFASSMSTSARESTSRAGGWGSCCALSVPARPASMAGIDRDALLDSAQCPDWHPKRLHIDRERGEESSSPSSETTANPFRAAAGDEVVWPASAPGPSSVPGCSSPAGSAPPRVADVQEHVASRSTAEAAAYRRRARLGGRWIRPTMRGERAGRRDGVALQPRVADARTHLAKYLYRPC